MPRPASQQGIHPVTQTLFLAYSMWDPEIHSTKQTIISAWTIYICIYMRKREREREIVRTLTPGASAPRNTACADDMASPSDFLFSISICGWDLETGIALSETFVREREGCEENGWLMDQLVQQLGPTWSPYYDKNKRKEKALSPNSKPFY